jgi:soluble lytic murein transglycosylase
MRKIIFFIFILCSIGAPLCSAEIFKFVDENGITHFTNIKPNQIKESRTYKKVVPPAVSGNIPSSSYEPEDYSQIIYSASRKYNLEPSLIRAVIKVESNWNPRAVSHKGAQGLMQLMPSTASHMKVRNPFDPEENIHGGSGYLRQLMDTFKEDISLALAAYNAGPDKVLKSGSIPPIRETQNYVKRVLSLYNGPGSFSVYKIQVSNGTYLYTNIPSNRKKTKISKF